MAYSRKWKPSKAKINEFKKQMEEIDEFCRKHSIQQSASSDSYYFTLNGQHYRISNHTIEASNAKAYDDMGQQIRQKYHPDMRKNDTIYIHASKTRLIEIYTSIQQGYDIDKRGNRISDTPTKVIEKQEYYKMSDGFFDYYVNKETGEKKFELGDKDSLIDSNLDDFSRPNAYQEQTSTQDFGMSM